MSKSFHDEEKDDKDDDVLRLLRLHARDDDPIVAQSAMVALDIADYVAGDEFEYCPLPDAEQK